MRGFVMMVLITMALAAGPASSGSLGSARDEASSWLVGRWRAAPGNSEHREIVLAADGRFVDTRSTASVAGSGTSRSSSSSASSRSGSWQLERDTLTLRAGSALKVYTIARLAGRTPRGPARMSLDGVVYDRVER